MPKPEARIGAEQLSWRDSVAIIAAQQNDFYQMEKLLKDWRVNSSGESFEKWLTRHEKRDFGRWFRLPADFPEMPADAQ